MTLGLSLETESRLCLLPPWKATNPLVALRTDQRHTGNIVSLLCPLKSLLLFLRTVLTFANAGGTVLRQSVKAAFEDFCCLRPTMFKCWLNFQFFPRRNSRNQEESFKHAPRMSDLLTVHLS